MTPRWGGGLHPLPAGIPPPAPCPVHGRDLVAAPPRLTAPQNAPHPASRCPRRLHGDLPRVGTASAEGAVGALLGGGGGRTPTHAPLAYRCPRRCGRSPSRCQNGWRCPRSRRTRSARRPPCPAGGTSAARSRRRRCRGPCPGRTARARPPPSGPSRGWGMPWAARRGARRGSRGSWEGRSVPAHPGRAGGERAVGEEVQPPRGVAPVLLTHCAGVPGGGSVVLAPGGDGTWGHSGVLGCWLLSAATQKR